MAADLRARGAAAQRVGQVIAAEQHFRDAIEADPTDHRGPQLLGVMLGELGRVDEAVELLSFATALVGRVAPATVAVHTDHAEALRRVGRIAEAERILHEIAAITGTDEATASSEPAS
jgi:Flp pilus assembly protein TadD